MGVEVDWPGALSFWIWGLGLSRSENLALGAGQPKQWGQQVVLALPSRLVSNRRVYW